MAIKQEEIDSIKGYTAEEVSVSIPISKLEAWHKRVQEGLYVRVQYKEDIAAMEREANAIRHTVLQELETELANRINY